MADLRFSLGIAIGTISLIGGALFLAMAISFQFLYPPPAFDQLKPVAGRVENIVEARTSSKGSAQAEIRLLTRKGTVCITIPRLGHLKRQQASAALLQIERNTPLVVMLDPDDGFAWEVRMSRSVVLPYASTVAADVETNKRIAIVGLFFFIFGVCCLVMVRRKQRSQIHIIS